MNFKKKEAKKILDTILLKNLSGGQGEKFKEFRQFKYEFS